MKQDDKRIEDLVNKLMTADSLEQAPINFTDNVMAKIETLSNSKATIYKPLIPKYILWLVGISFIAIIGYILFKQPTGNSDGLLDKFNLPEFNLLEGVSFEFSNVLVYAMLLLAIMFSIQVPLLKHYFDKRMSF
ncbi:hypothetical protein FBALC1_05193 [Flavobacteriales bacterium ALC-1]|nr:hypothetical protein FBALC1_05193 [Flavobacteriales bacterium ALC-1]